MKSKEKEITTDYKIADQQFPQPLENALQIVKQRTEKILDNFSDCEVILCAGDVDNFRMKLPYPTKYKKNRDTALRPLLLKEVHSYFKRKYKAVVAQSGFRKLDGTDGALYKFVYIIRRVKHLSAVSCLGRDIVGTVDKDDIIIFAIVIGRDDLVIELLQYGVIL